MEIDGLVNANASSLSSKSAERLRWSSATLPQAWKGYPKFTSCTYYDDRLYLEKVKINQRVATGSSQTPGTRR
jgi:hypothetical protein